MGEKGMRCKNTGKRKVFGKSNRMRVFICVHTGHVSSCISLGIFAGESQHNI